MLFFFFFFFFLLTVTITDGARRTRCRLVILHDAFVFSFCSFFVVRHIVVMHLVVSLFMVVVGL